MEIIYGSHRVSWWDVRVRSTRPIWCPCRRCQQLDFVRDRLMHDEDELNHKRDEPEPTD